MFRLFNDKKFINRNILRQCLWAINDISEICNILHVLLRSSHFLCSYIGRNGDFQSVSLIFEYHRGSELQLVFLKGQQFSFYILNDSRLV